MSARPDKVAHDAIDVLASAYERARDMGADNIGEVLRFTPSVKVGRRYLHVVIDDVPYTFTLEVETGSDFT